MYVCTFKCTCMNCMRLLQIFPLIVFLALQFSVFLFDSCYLRFHDCSSLFALTLAWASCCSTFWCPIRGLNCWCSDFNERLCEWPLWYSVDHRHSLSWKFNENEILHIQILNNMYQIKFLYSASLLVGIMMPIKKNFFQWFIKKYLMRSIILQSKTFQKVS